MSALALALAASGDVTESLALFRRALQLQPDDPEIGPITPPPWERLRRCTDRTASGFGFQASR
jgi:hypothetical protein